MHQRIKNLDQRITRLRRGDRIPVSARLRLAWIHYCKYLILKENDSNSKDLLIQIREARKVAKKGGDTDYHGFFEKLIDELQSIVRQEYHLFPL